MRKLTVIGRHLIKLDNKPVRPIKKIKYDKYIANIFKDIRGGNK